ncbi:MAG: hypothetical protein RIB97_12255 [Nitratireductor sp.]
MRTVLALIIGIAVATPATAQVGVGSELQRCVEENALVLIAEERLKQLP